MFSEKDLFIRSTLMGILRISAIILKQATPSGIISSIELKMDIFFENVLVFYFLTHY